MRKDAVGRDDPTPEEPLPDGKKKRGRKRTKPRKGRKWKIAELLQSSTPQSVSIVIYGESRTLHCVTYDLWITDVLLQRVRVVVIETPTGLSSC